MEQTMYVVSSNHQIFVTIFTGYWYVSQGFATICNVKKKYPASLIHLNSLDTVYLSDLGIHGQLSINMFHSLIHWGCSVTSQKLIG